MLSIAAVVGAGGWRNDRDVKLEWLLGSYIATYVEDLFSIIYSEVPIVDVRTVTQTVPIADVRTSSKGLGSLVSWELYTKLHLLV